MLIRPSFLNSNLDFILFWRGAIVTDSHDVFTNTRQHLLTTTVVGFNLGLPVNPTSQQQFTARHASRYFIVLTCAPAIGRQKMERIAADRGQHILPASCRWLQLPRDG
jgi:hypothetical protein